MQHYKNRFQQFQLFKLALQEENLLFDDADIEIDHQKGKNYVNDIEFDLKYPKSYIQLIENLDQNKTYQYTFQGAIIPKLGRDKLLEDFIARADSLVINTKKGLKRKDKTIFDKNYYNLISSAYFSLCPNHIGDWYQNGWTYRFIESLLCRSIPILFEETPLSNDFIKDFYYFTNKQIHIMDKYQEKVEENFKKAVEKWTLTLDEIEILRNV